LEPGALAGAGPDPTGPGCMETATGLGTGDWGPGDLGTWGWGDCDFVMGGGVECVELILANMGMIDGNWGIGRMRIEVLRLKLCCQGLLGDQDNTILSFQDSVGLPAVQHGQLRQPRVSERLG